MREIARRAKKKHPAVKSDRYRPFIWARCHSLSYAWSSGALSLCGRAVGREDRERKASETWRKNRRTITRLSSLRRVSYSRRSPARRSVETLNGTGEQRICGTCWTAADDCAQELYDALAGEGLQETVANPADTINRGETRWQTRTR